jgi:hypothetical protein
MHSSHLLRLAGLQPRGATSALLLNPATSQLFAALHVSHPLCLSLQDFSREVLRIDAIPTKKLDTIKEWLTSVKIKYYESKMNLAWKPILKHILEDPNTFIAEVRFNSMHRSCHMMSWIVWHVRC